MKNSKIVLAELMKKNKEHTHQYKNSSIMELLDLSAMSSAHTRENLLSCIQVFSDYFQKTVMLRATLTEQNSFFQIAWQHLEEEFGHNRSLLADRGYSQPDFDPILDGCSSWFAWKMLTLDNVGKAFLMHFVLESSANVFFQKAHKIMQRYKETNYFELHSELDAEHEMMGLGLLENLREAEYQQLFEIQEQGWLMINTICDQISNKVRSAIALNQIKAAC